MKLITALLALTISTSAYAGTACDEWANFTKIITFKFRDKGFDIEDVKKELDKAMHGNPELPEAMSWIDYTYEHKDLSPVGVWNGVYGQCQNTKPTL